MCRFTGWMNPTARAQSYDGMLASAVLLSQRLIGRKDFEAED